MEVNPGYGIFFLGYKQLSTIIFIAQLVSAQRLQASLPPHGFLCGEQLALNLEVQKLLIVVSGEFKFLKIYIYFFVPLESAQRLSIVSFVSSSKIFFVNKLIFQCLACLPRMNSYQNKRKFFKVGFYFFCFLCYIEAPHLLSLNFIANVAKFCFASV